MKLKDFLNHNLYSFVRNLKGTHWILKNQRK